jgi:hypothetical protein
MPYSLVFALVETNAVSVSIELACGHCYVYGSWRRLDINLFVQYTGVFSAIL